MKAMKRLSASLVILISFLAFSSPSANASQGSLTYCQKTSDKVRYYSSLRKKGGPAKTMEIWKQQRENFKKQFELRNCKKWRGKLKN